MPCFMSESINPNVSLQPNQILRNGISHNFCQSLTSEPDDVISSSPIPTTLFEDQKDGYQSLKKSDDHKNLQPVLESMDYPDGLSSL